MGDGDDESWTLGAGADCLFVGFTPARPAHSTQLLGLVVPSVVTAPAGSADR